MKFHKKKINLIGYSIIDDFIDKNSIQKLKKYYSEVLAESEKENTIINADICDSLVYIDNPLYDKENESPFIFKETIMIAKKIAAKVFNVEPKWIDCKARFFHKKSKARETKWHQDDAYVGSSMNSFSRINIWIPLQDTDENNGCLRYLPHSHLKGLLPHKKEINKDGVETLYLSVPKTANIRTVPLKIGQACVHHPLVIHSAFPNNTENDRMALALVCRKTR